MARKRLDEVSVETPRLAVIGRPNVGKSSFVNRFLKAANGGQEPALADRDGERLAEVGDVDGGFGHGIREPRVGTR